MFYDRVKHGNLKYHANNVYRKHNPFVTAWESLVCSHVKVILSAQRFYFLEKYTWTNIHHIPSRFLKKTSTGCNIKNSQENLINDSFILFSSRRRKNKSQTPFDCKYVTAKLFLFCFGTYFRVGVSYEIASNNM